MSAAPPIVVDGLTVRLGGRVVIDALDARIPGGGITAVIGPNGAGKSVLLRALDGLVPAEAGEIRFGARPLTSVRRAFVFQKPGLIRASVAHNVALALGPLRLPRAEAAGRVDSALRRVGLHGRAEDAARKLSGGEQQRLALARAWATEPDLLLLDEPTANLDPGATEEVEALVLSIAKAGAKVIVVSHNLGQVGRLAEDVLVISRGQAVEHGPTSQVLSRPRTPEAQRYINGELPWTRYAAAC